MFALLSAERIKLASTRSPYWSLIGIVAAVMLMTLPFSLSDRGEHATIGLSQAGMQLGMMVFMVLAALTMTTEHRFGTIRVAFLATPRRDQVFLAKTIVVATLGALVAAVLGPAAFWVTKLMAAEPARPLELVSAADYRQVFGSAALFAVAAVVAIAVGTLIRQSAGAITILMVWPMLVESLVGLIPNVGMKISQWLPFTAGSAFTTSPADLEASMALGGGQVPDEAVAEIMDAAASAPGPLAGLGVFAGAALVLWVLALVTLKKRDA